MKTPLWIICTLLVLLMMIALLILHLTGVISLQPQKDEFCSYGYKCIVWDYKYKCMAWMCEENYQCKGIFGNILNQPKGCY